MNPYTIDVTGSEKVQTEVFEQGMEGVLEGCVYGFPAEKYHALKNYVSSSTVAAVEISARAAHHAMHSTFSQTDSMAIGTMIHEATLELDRFLNTYLIGPPVARNTKAWKAAVAEAHPKILLKADTYHQVLTTARNVIDHPKVGPMLRGGHAEVSLFWRDEDTGLLCRARPDYLTPDRLYVPDLKTTDDVRHRPFSETVARYSYHVKQAFYLAGVRAVFGTDAQTGLLIAAQRSEPFEVQPYWLAPDEFSGVDQMQVGRYVMRKNLRVLKQCLDTGIWPRRSEEIEPLTLPVRITKKFQYVNLDE